MLSHQLRKIDTKSEHIPFEGPPYSEASTRVNSSFGYLRLLHI